MKMQLLRRGVTAAAMIACAAGISAAHAQDAYKIGYITDLSGPLAGSYTPTWEGFELYIKALNDRGGINGKKVDVVLDDDGLKADRAVAAAKKQTERDQVLALGQQLQTQPVDGIRCVRDQLTQEDLLVAVQRVDHQVQELDHLRLEAERLLILHRHRLLPLPNAPPEPQLP